MSTKTIVAKLRALSQSAVDEHLPDRAGNCVGCAAAGAQEPANASAHAIAWPCEIFRLVDEAERVPGLLALDAAVASFR
ncbi:MAG: hypothetical protein M3Z25_05885 [Actinomycetota bacterium]|nr:hypothetical protein [Actinomycetota bacterium]